MRIDQSMAVPAQGHAGVFGRLPAGEDLVITHYRHLVLRVQDLQSTDLQAEDSLHTAQVFNTGSTDCDTLTLKHFSTFKAVKHVT